MICVKKITDEKVLKCDIDERAFVGGHYCYNWTLLKELKNGPYKFWNLLKGLGHMFFFAVYDGESIVMIVPCFRKGKTLIMVGSAEAFDYVDSFYSSKASAYNRSAAFGAFLDGAKRDGIEKIIWKWCPDDSPSKELLMKQSSLDIRCEAVDNTEITFSDYDLHKASLSKSTRQNLRTAVNRLKRDKKDFQYKISLLDSITDSEVEACLDLYYCRQERKYGLGTWRQLIKKHIDFNTRLMRKRKGVIAILKIDGAVTSFMFGYLNKVDHSLEIPKLAIDDTYGFYSPGMLLVDMTLEALAKHTDIRKLDLCRGTEQYKLKMGGHIYPTYNFEIKL